MWDVVIRRMRVGKYTEVLRKYSTLKVLQEVHGAVRVSKRKTVNDEAGKMAGNPS